MNSKVYKWCAVPYCTNTSIKTPNKVFVHVPNKKLMRDKWLKLAQRNTNDVVTNSPLYFCEDHFDLPNDMENYMQYHVMGSVAQVRMKSGCLPTKFECQSDQNAEEFLKRPHKRKTGKVLVECEEPLHEIGLDLEDHLEKFVCSSGTMPSKFDCQVDPTKRLLDTTMSQKTYINKDIKEGTEFAADGIAQMECPDDWSISNTDMETKPLLKNVATNALVTVDKQTQASFKLLNRSKAVQTNATIVDVSHLLHNSPSALTMKMADKTMKCDQISSMSEQSHDIIYTVYNYLLKEYEYLKGLNLSAEELTTLEDTLSRTAKATGVSVETVTAILVLKELEKTESKNEQITLEHNYHQTNREVSQRCTPEKNKSKVSASVKKVAQRCKSAKNKNKVSASVKKAAQRCTSEKNKNKVAASVKVTSNKRKRKRGKHWSRPKQKSVRLDSEFDDTTMNNESTDSADESIMFNLNNKEDIKRNGLIENKSICHNRHMEQYREEEDYSIKEKDIQQDSSIHSYNMQEELVLKCEVFNDDSNTEEEVENCSVIADDSQDNNSPHSYNIQDELVLKCEVFDDNINESPSRAEGLTTDSSVVEVKVEREDDGMEL